MLEMANLVTSATNEKIYFNILYSSLISIVVDS